MGKQFIYVDTRQQVSKVDGAAYYMIYKLQRELTEDEMAELATANKVPEFPGMRLPKPVKVSEYPAYVEKHEGRGDIVVKLPLN